MFEFNWRNGFAIGLASGIGLTVFVMLTDQFLGYDRDKVSAAQSQDQTAANHGQYFPDNSLWHWDGRLVSSGDTLAQWVMAILTIVAVGLLWGTLRQANETNRAAVLAARAAQEANKIMKSEQRPWVTLIREPECDFADFDNLSCRLSWNFNFENKGRTPAYDTEYKVKIFRTDDAHIDILGLNDFCQKVAGETSVTTRRILFPGETTNIRRFRSFVFSVYGIAPGSDGYLTPICSNGEKIFAFFCLKYRLGIEPDAPIGLEGRVFSIEPIPDLIGPWRHRMIEYGIYRIAQ